ncbi:MFS general substrate transporter [Rhizodiscina lignyota]|uniref:MFS general substrate transporter n=1 Tax=Rhizodiscina lignyota TaxID=1504668 RepID=A0A9P4M5H9_9PEZI|nr:MFS general substrate transporter [Rhizodiscina lignyota]
MAQSEREHQIDEPEKVGHEVGVEESAQEWDPAIERKILRKLDFGILPVLWFLFLVSFVDRGNIGNAKIAGMTKDLHLVGNRYNVAVQVFTAAYVAFGLPANILFKKIGPRSLPAMMFLWGLTVIGQGVTASYQGLAACRFLEGMCEAGFVPGAAYLIGSYYKRDEFLKRYTFFFGAAIVAGAFNGLLSYAIAKMAGVGGYNGWRWIFILEGCTTVLVASISFFLIVPFPQQSKFLDPKEKKILLARLEADGANVKHDQLRLLDALKDWKIWAATMVYIGAEENASSVVAFQPTVLSGLGYTSSAAQVHTIPVYAVAWVLSMTCAFFADRLRQRYIFAMVGMILTTVGLAIEIAQPKAAGARYAGMFFLTSGPYIVMPVTVVWLAINLGKGYKRTVGLGVLIAVGNCGALVSANVFLTSETPKFHTGFSVGMGMNMLCAIGLTWLYIGLRMENRRRDKTERVWNGTTEEDLARLQDLGDQHPDFRYSL